MARMISIVLVLFLFIGLCGCDEAPAAVDYTTGPADAVEPSPEADETATADTDGTMPTDDSALVTPDATDPDGTATAQAGDTAQPEPTPSADATGTGETTASPAPTATPSQNGTLLVDPVIGKAVVSEFLPLRKTASSSGKVLAQIPKGGEFTVLLVETGKKWLKVKYDGKTGFVPFKYVTVGSEEGDLVCTVFCNSVLNVREGAGTNYDVIGAVGSGTNLIVKSKTTVNGKTWYKVEIGSSYGYVIAQYCRIAVK